MYPVLVKQFWVHPTAEKETITSYVMNRKIVINIKSIADLLPHNGKGKRIHNAKINTKREVVIAPIIFKVGTNLEDDKRPSAKDLTNRLRVWFKIIFGCIHHRPITSSSDYVNTRQKFMLFFLEKGLKLGLPSICSSSLGILSENPEPVDLRRITKASSSPMEGSFLTFLLRMVLWTIF